MKYLNELVKVYNPPSRSSAEWASGTIMEQTSDFMCCTFWSFFPLHTSLCLFTWHLSRSPLCWCTAAWFWPITELRPALTSGGQLSPNSQISCPGFCYLFSVFTTRLRLIQAEEWDYFWNITIQRVVCSENSMHWGVGQGIPTSWLVAWVFTGALFPFAEGSESKVSLPVDSKPLGQSRTQVTRQHLKPGMGVRMMLIATKIHKVGATAASTEMAEEITKEFENIVLNMFHLCTDQNQAAIFKSLIIKEEFHSRCWNLLAVHNGWKVSVHLKRNKINTRELSNRNWVKHRVWIS